MEDLKNYSDSELIELAETDFDKELKGRGFEYGWYKPEVFVGAIYILINPAFPNLVKIGYADDVMKRLKTLNRSSGLPDPYHCYAIYKVKKRLEDLRLHSLIDTLDPQLRHAKNREFYEMDVEKAYGILSAIAQINGNEEQLIMDPFKDDFFELTPPYPRDPGEKQSRLKFSMLGIPVGSELTYKRDESIKCITCDDDNQVEYNGEVYSLSGLARKLLGKSAIQGGRMFKYNDEILTEMRKRLGV